MISRSTAARKGCARRFRRACRPVRTCGVPGNPGRRKSGTKLFRLLASAAATAATESVSLLMIMFSSLKNLSEAPLTGAGGSRDVFRRLRFPHFSGRGRIGSQEPRSHGWFPRGLIRVSRELSWPGSFQGAELMRENRPPRNCASCGALSEVHGREGQWRRRSTGSASTARQREADVRAGCRTRCSLGRLRGMPGRSSREMDQVLAQLFGCGRIASRVFVVPHLPEANPDCSPWQLVFHWCRL